MNVAQKRALVLSIAAKKVGIKESPSGSNNVIFNTLFYGREVRDGFGLDGKENRSAKYPWCATSMSEIFNEAKLPLGVIDYKRGFAGCPYAIRCLSDPALAHKKWGEIVTFEQAEPGDLIFFDWNVDGKWDHVGMLKSKNPPMNSFETYEGNTSYKDQSNGGEFMNRKRLIFPGLIFVKPNVFKDETKA